jgi:hypothetical protein
VRPRASRILVVLATVALVGALLAGYARRAAFDADQFANRATSALEDDSVRGLIAERITDDVVLRAEADLVAARPAIEAAAETVIGSAAFTELFRAGVRDLHRALIGGDKDTVTLTLVDVGTVLEGALQAFDPRLAERVEKRAGSVEVVKRDIGTLTADLTRLAERLGWLAVVLFVLSLGAFAAALVLSPDRRRTIGESGVWLAGAGVLMVLSYAILHALALGQVDEPAGRDAAGAVWDAFLGDLRTAAWILAGSGSVVAAAAASLLRPIDVEDHARRLWQAIAREPERPLPRVLRAAGLVLAGVLIITQRDTVLELAVTLVGVYVIYKGAEAVLRMVVGPEAPTVEVRERGGIARGRLRQVAAAGLAAGAIVAAVGLFVGLGGTSEAAPEIEACNGHEELCERRLNEVAFAATHNSMSVPLPGWFSAEQEAPIRQQLEDGIRGLLIDTHYGVKLPEGKVKTELAEGESATRSTFEDGIGPEAFDAALRIRDRLGFAGKGERGMYLCHSFCELGFTALDSVLEDIRDFLVANPHEVVVIVNQDDVSPADFVKAVEDAGLDEFAYRGPATPPFPTLSRMIEQDQRLVVMAEAQAGGAPWYRPAYRDLVQETPFKFGTAAQLTDSKTLQRTCEPNRGPGSAPLFLINHWVSTDPLPRPSDARKVNDYAPLLRRANQCRRRRDRLPNLLAVNFYREGDLFRVVDELNRVDPPSASG